MKHVLIIAGGHLNIDFAKAYLKTLSYDKVFAVDKGLEYADALGIVPNYVIGDFDTVDCDLLLQYENHVNNDEACILIERYPAKKSATDTELAVDKAIDIGAEVITLLAGTGCRLDHVLANIGLLIQTAERGVVMYIVDETNRIQIMMDTYCPRCVIQKDNMYGKYISLVAVTPQVEGVTLKGAVYPLVEENVIQGSSRTISNEIQDNQLEIYIRKGKMLVMESRDEVVLESRDEMASFFL